MSSLHLYLSVTFSENLPSNLYVEWSNCSKALTRTFLQLCAASPACISKSLLSFNSIEAFISMYGRGGILCAFARAPLSNFSLLHRKQWTIISVIRYQKIINFCYTFQPKYLVHCWSKEKHIVFYAPFYSNHMLWWCGIVVGQTSHFEWWPVAVYGHEPTVYTDMFSAWFIRSADLAVWANAIIWLAEELAPTPIILPSIFVWPLIFNSRSISSSSC